MGSGSAGGCQRCSGIWLDDAAFAEVRSRHYASIAAGALAGSPNEAKLDRSAPLACPQCRNAMKRTRLSHVDVDVCVGHGIWFDRDELTEVARAIALAHADPGAVSGREITPELEDELARSVTRDLADDKLRTDFWGFVTDVVVGNSSPIALRPLTTETLDDYLVQRAQAPRQPRVLRCPNCNGTLPPDARGRWVCQYCNATLDI